MTSPSDETEQFAPDPAPDTAQFPVTRVESEPAETRPQHAVTSGTKGAAGIGRAGWWAITIAAAAWLIIGFLLAFGPARYWTPVPAVFLGYFLVSGVIGLVFWKGVRELRDSNPTLHSGDGPASPGARVAAAVGAVGIASALVLLPAGLSSAPANALPCPDGSNTCGPTAPTQDQPTQGNGGNTTAPQAPQTTIPPNADTGLPQAPTQGNGNGFQGTVQQMPTPDNVDPNSCIFNCGPTQGQQAPQTGQATPPQTGQQNPVTTAPNTPATTPQRPATTTPKLRTPTPETTTSTSSKARDTNEQRSSNEDRDKNSGIPYQAAELAAVAGTYRRKKISESAVRSGRVVSENVSKTLARGLSDNLLAGPDPDRQVFRAGPVTKADFDNWGKAVDFIYGKMIENRNGTDFRLMDIAGPATPYTLTRFAILNKGDGAWDYKRPIAAMYGVPSPAYLVFPGDPDWRISTDIWTNMHYGYIGRQLGIPLGVLLAASRAAGNPDPVDDISIRAGFDLGTMGPDELTTQWVGMAATDVAKQLIAMEKAGQDLEQVRPA